MCLLPFFLFRVVCWDPLPNFDWVIVFLLLNSKSSLYVLVVTPLSDKICSYFLLIFSYSVDWLFTFLMMSFGTRRLIIKVHLKTPWSPVGYHQCYKFYLDRCWLASYFLRRNTTWEYLCCLLCCVSPESRFSLCLESACCGRVPCKTDQYVGWTRRIKTKGSKKKTVRISGFGFGFLMWCFFFLAEWLLLMLKHLISLLKYL